MQRSHPDTLEVHIALWPYPPIACISALRGRPDLAEIGQNRRDWPIASVRRAAATSELGVQRTFPESRRRSRS